MSGNADVRSSVADRSATLRLLVEKQAKQLLIGFGRFLVTLNPTEGEEEKGVFIGSVGLKRRQTAGASRVPDIGFALLRPFWGKGYATEACQGLLGYYERERGLKEVFGFCHPGNENSMKMFPRLGFEDRGVKSLKGLGDAGQVVQGQVWAARGMSEDLGVYGL